MEKPYAAKYLLETGMGLQDVDSLSNSSYFLSEASRYLDGEISLDELDRIIASYYQSKPSVEDRNEEADKVSIRIAKILSEDSFSFTVGQLLTIHRMLFKDILPHPGQLRSYNFIKHEWVLDGASVIYGDFHELEMTLQYDFDLEKKFDYRNLSMDETIEHLAIFIANLWQIHVFEEGNTRTTTVFFIKYLRSLGFDVANDTFAKNAWYFRNALVRANYTNVAKQIYEDRSYLIKFLRNLLLNEKNELKNRELHIGAASSNNEANHGDKVIAMIRCNPKVTSYEMAKALGVSLRTTKSVLKRLTDAGRITRINGKRYGYWQISTNNK